MIRKLIAVMGIIVTVVFLIYFFAAPEATTITTQYYADLTLEEPRMTAITQKIDADSLSADHIFTKLIENNDQCLVNCHAVYEIFNPSTKPLSLEFLTTGFAYGDADITLYQYGSVRSVKLYYKNMEYYNTTEIVYTLCQKEETVAENKTIIKHNISYICGNKTKITQLSRPALTEITSGTKIPPHTTWIIRLEATKTPNPNVDWIPVLSITDTDYITESKTLEQSKWAWWNSSWTHKQEINIDHGGAASTNYKVKIELNSTNVGASFNWSLDQDSIRFLNSTEDGELTLYRESWNTAAENATFWVEIPYLATTNETIYMYYGNVLASDVTDFEGVVEELARGSACTAKSSHSAPYTCENAWDGDRAGWTACWLGADTDYTAWVSGDFPSAGYVSRILAWSAPASYCPQNYTWDISDSAGTHVYSNNSWFDCDGVQNDTLPNASAIPAVKGKMLNFTSIYPNASHNSPGLADIEVYGWNFTTPEPIISIGAEAEVAVNQAPTFDQTPPDITHELGDSFSLIVNATDDNNISNIIINDTGTFSISVNGTTADTQRAGTITDDAALDLGIYYLNITAYDGVGQEDAEMSIITVSDTTLPIFNETLSANYNIEWGNAFSLQINKTELRFDSHLTNDTTNTIISATGLLENATALAKGELAIQITINDTSGNSAANNTIINVSDNTAPTWNQTPTDQEYVLGADFDYQVNATNDPWEDPLYYLNDTTNFTISTAGLLENSTALTENVYYLIITANDTTGNLLTINLKISKTGLTFDQTPTAQTLEYDSAFEYIVNTTESSGLGVDTIILNDTTQFTITMNGSSGDVFRAGTIANVSTVPIGVHYLTVTANDTGGSTSAATFSITTSDTTVPTWDTTPTPQSYDGTTGIFTYTVTASDAQTITYNISDLINFTINEATGAITNNTLLTASVYNLTINATDASGNYIDANITVNKDTTLSWTQTEGDWNTQSFGRFATLSLTMNASANAAITYSDNSTAVTTNTTSGAITYKPDDDFVGVIWLTVRASNDSGVTNVTNELRITTTYVDYYAKPGNMSNIGGLVEYGNEATGDLLAVAILVGFFFVLFMSMKVFPTEHALTASSIMVGVVAVYFYVSGWVDIWLIEILAVMMVIGIFILLWRR